MKDQHQGIEGDGWFWPLGQDRSQAVPGFLVATVDEPIELVLLQPMLHTEDRWATQDVSGATAPAAYGYVGKTPVTLLNLRSTGRTWTVNNPLAGCGKSEVWVRDLIWDRKDCRHVSW